MNDNCQTPVRDTTNHHALELEIRRRSRRSFVIAGISAAAGLTALNWLRTRPDDGGVPWPLRRILEWNERLSRSRFGNGHLARNFPMELAKMPRENGDVGLNEDIDLDSWSLRVINGPGQRSIEFTLADIKSFPRVEMVTELHCIEGWSEIVCWAGARFSSLMDKVGSDSRYVSCETPNGTYYVGFDIESAAHPQTLLCYEMNGRPLAPEHGAPLRLATPVKYGIKNIKRIGTIRFTNTRPSDYWAERGYDWYAGL
jgi:hypothetical protein